MGNRFGFKDFLLLTFIVLLILVIFLGMVQLDQHKQALSKLQDKADLQGSLVNALDKKLKDQVSQGARQIELLNQINLTLQRAYRPT